MTTVTMPPVLDKKADLAGPGISTYEEVAKILPDNYAPLLDRKETQKATAAVKRFIEDGLCRELNLFRVEVPLIVTEEQLDEALTAIDAALAIADARVSP